MKDCIKCNKEETVDSQTVIQCFHDSIITPTSPPSTT